MINFKIFYFSIILNNKNFGSHLQQNLVPNFSQIQQRSARQLNALKELSNIMHKIK